MKDIQQEIKASIVFSAHDLGVVVNGVDRVAVMYGGRIVEIGASDEIFYNLQYPLKVRDIIAEDIDIHKLAKNVGERNKRIDELLKLVGLDPSHGTRYPHEFSGGQRQRIGIARTLAIDPKFIICDELVSALDVSIQAQVVNLLQELQEKQQLTYLFIAHDLSMVKYISNCIGVMYYGKLVEIGSAEEIYKYGLHPYTESLLSAIPLPDPEYERHRVRTTYKPEKTTATDLSLREISDLKI
nr:ATP-binding cassette domain-containing protein [Vagococcus sp. CY53-2]